MELNESQSIRDVYEKYFRVVTYFSFQLVKNKDEAENIAMEVFLKYIDRKDKFTSDNSVKSFLFKAARNRCIDYLRKQKSSKNYLRHIASLGEENLDITENNELILANIIQAVYAEIENLPQQRKAVFKAIYFEGKNTAAIAHELGISPQTVLNQKSKAIHAIKIKIIQGDLAELPVIAGLLDILFLFFLNPNS
jgi:RNA polymerase sigma-70 factor (family 1)